MPRKKVEGKAIKRRSRGGCHNCKRLKIKCDEIKPKCGNCSKHDYTCDYSLKLSWGGRSVKKETQGTDLTNSVVLEQISQLHKYFEPVPIQNSRQLQFVLESPETDGGALDLDYDEVLRERQQQEEHSLVRLPSRMQQFAADLQRVESFEIGVIHELSPLPDTIQKIPFHREIYHHFLDVVADVLVPVPKSLYPDNPFRTILPRMAMQTPHLLSLMLAYGASHRAKYLRIPEPTETIFELLSETLNGLTNSLKNEQEAKSDSTLATAIMLTSYEILCGKLSDSWRTHLHGAREIVMARGMSDAWTLNERPAYAAPYHPTRFINTDVHTNEASYFLLRIFAYLDVIAALCSPLASSYLMNNDDVSQWSVPALPPSPTQSPPGWGHINAPNVDFMLGVDLNVIPIFNRVSYLDRRRLQDLDEREEKELNDEIAQVAEQLKSACISPDALDHGYGTQLQIMNTTFCYATMIDMYTRAARLPSEAPEVQEAVHTITGLLEMLPQHSDIFACLTFPIVTSGCEAIDEDEREKYRKWMFAMDRYGAKQIDQGRNIMELCWKTNSTWDQVVNDLGWDIALI